MQIPLKWINELVNIDSISQADLIDRLTLGGFEVENIIKLKIENHEQVAFDISATANRSNSLSIQGLSSEITTLLDKFSTISRYSTTNWNWKTSINENFQTIPKNINCSIFISIIIKNFEDFTVPKWLKQKLISSGLTPTNNINDFQTYILLETGYPINCYDYDKICLKLKQSHFKLFFEKAFENQNFAVNDKLEYKLNSSDILIKANNLILGLAGIIENQDYLCSGLTNSILIEGSIFTASNIRKQSRRLGIRTDRSARYEKSLKDTFLIESLYRFISLLKISNPSLICELHTCARVPRLDPILIKLKYETIKEILGQVTNQSQKNLGYIKPETITNYLVRLNFPFIYDDREIEWEIQVPESRSDDITREIDLIEEIGRLHGFNNFITTLPKIKTIGTEDLSYKTRKKITSCLLNLGFNEIINYSLVNKKTFLKNEIQLVNPLLVDCSTLRISLLPNLVKIVQENLKQGNLTIEGFEYGHVFSGDIKTNFTEKEYVGGIFGGIKKKLNWIESEQILTWFEAKGKINQLLTQLNLSTYWIPGQENNNSILHPYRSAEIYLSDGRKLGIFGQINLFVANKLNIPLHIYLFEFDFEVMKIQLQQNKLSVYRDYSFYPKITKDLSFIVPKTVSFDKLKNVLYFNGTEFLTEIKLLDEYQGKTIPDTRTSLCIQLIFQSKTKTLENKYIESIIQNLKSLLIEKFDAFIRN